MMKKRNVLKWWRTLGAIAAGTLLFQLCACTTRNLPSKKIGGITHITSASPGSTGDCGTGASRNSASDSRRSPLENPDHPFPEASPDPSREEVRKELISNLESSWESLCRPVRSYHVIDRVELSRGEVRMSSEVYRDPLCSRDRIGGADSRGKVVFGELTEARIRNERYPGPSRETIGDIADGETITAIRIDMIVDTVAGEFQRKEEHKGLLALTPSGELLFDAAVYWGARIGDPANPVPEMISVRDEQDRLFKRAPGF